MAGAILLGVVTGAHGLKGEVKVKTFTETPDKLGLYGPLQARDGRAFVAETVRIADTATAVVHFKGIEDRTSAEALKGLELYVPRAALPATEVEEYYHADLVGLRAEDEAGRLIGHITGIHNFGAGDVLGIEKPDGSEALLPFAREFIPVVDVAGGRVVVAAPELAEAQEKGNVE